MNDNYSFQNIEELYKRLRPAITCKVEELRRENISYITEKDIWTFLSNSNWRKRKDLEFYEMVDSILNLDLASMDEYLKNKISYQEKIEDDSIL